MGLDLNLEFMRIDTKSSKFSQCSNNHTQRVMLGYLKIRFLACFIGIIRKKIGPTECLV